MEYFVSASLEVSFFDDPNSQAHCGAADSGFSEYRWECTGLLLKGHKLAAEAAVTVVVVLLATTALSIIVNLKIVLAATAATQSARSTSGPPRPNRSRCGSARSAVYTGPCEACLCASAEIV